MRSDSLNRWLTLIANFGVIIGLVLLIMEINQTHELMSAQTRNELSKQIVELLSVISTNSQLADVMNHGNNGDSLTNSQIVQYEHRTLAIFRYWENVYYQYNQGLYDDNEYVSQKLAWKRYFIFAPPAKDIWMNVRETFSMIFRKEIDKIISDINSER